MEQGVPAGGKDVVLTRAEEGGLPPGPPYDCEARTV